MGIHSKPSLTKYTHTYNYREKTTFQKKRNHATNRQKKDKKYPHPNPQSPINVLRRFHRTNRFRTIFLDRKHSTKNYQSTYLHTRCLLFDYTVSWSWVLCAKSPRVNFRY